MIYVIERDLDDNLQMIYVIYVIYVICVIYEHYDPGPIRQRFCTWAAVKYFFHGRVSVWLDTMKKTGGRWTYFSLPPFIVIFSFI